jgi:hypothetical protein
MTKLRVLVIPPGLALVPLFIASILFAHLGKRLRYLQIENHACGEVMAFRLVS